MTMFGFGLEIIFLVVLAVWIWRRKPRRDPPFSEQPRRRNRWSIWLG